MAFRFRQLNDAVDGPIFDALHDVGTSHNGSTVSVSDGYTTVSGVQGVNQSASFGSLSTTSVSGTQVMFGFVVSNDESYTFAAGSVEGDHNGETELYEESFTEVSGQQEFTGQSETFEDSFLEVIGYRNTSTPNDVDAIAQATAAILGPLVIDTLKADLPALVNAAVQSHEVRPGLTVALKEFIESGALFGTHTQGKVLPGTQFPVSPGTVMKYMDPLDPSRTALEYTIDTQGNRRVLAVFDKDGNRIEVSTYP